MRKFLGIAFLLLISMYFFPHVWYFVMAVAMLVVVMTLCLALLAFMAKALGIAGLEVWLAQRFLRKKKRS